jgi:hypothetical protein
MGTRKWIALACYCVVVPFAYPQTNIVSHSSFGGDSTGLDDTLQTDGLSQTSLGSESENKSTAFSNVDYTRLAIVGAGSVALIAGIHIYQQNGWWKNNRAPFHFREDLTYGLWVDKIGHFYGATLGTFLARKAYEWTNVSEEAALWMGSGTSFLFQTYIEIEDGFSKWGFDRVDFALNVGGALWPVAQYYSPFLQNFDLKFSYHPSPLLHSASGVGFQGQQHLIFDDYEGQTLWLSIKVHDLLPVVARSYWPDFLCLAVGYGARDIASQNAYPILLLALDYDMTKIIPPNTWFLKTLGEALNVIHFPAPAVRFTPSAVWYGLYF